MIPIQLGPPSSSQIQLQPMVENIRDKLAENIHEMWAVSKIESGWQFGEGGRLDEEMMLHPCLTQFQTLPQAEKRYNIQLAIQTLRQAIRSLKIKLLLVGRGPKRPKYELIC